MDVKKNLKVGVSPVGKMSVVCAILQNAHTILCGNTIDVGNSDVDSQLFWLIKKSYFELLTNLNIENYD